MSTLCLSDLGELRDEWLREPPTNAAADTPRAPATPDATAVARGPAAMRDDEAVAA